MKNIISESVLPISPAKVLNSVGKNNDKTDQLFMKYDVESSESSDFLISVIGAAPYGIIAIDQEGNITMANGQVVEYLYLDVTVEELSKMNILEVISGVGALKRKVKRCLTKGTKDFNIYEVQLNERYLTFRGRKIAGGMLITMADITFIKEAEHNALNSMLEGQELERKRLAQEIHDGIGPILSTVKMNLANIEDDVEHVNHSLAEKFRDSYHMIDEAANDLRSISHNLLPKVLLDFGLIEALETLCEKIDATKNVEVDFIYSGMESRLEEVTELGLYRISQELINNTLKYAHAKKITLQLLKRDTSLQLMYEDDGKGFNPETVNEGIGLMNIRNRTLALAGEVIIDSQASNGMTATVEIPLN